MEKEVDNFRCHNVSELRGIRKDIVPKRDFYTWMGKWFPKWEPQYGIPGPTTSKGKQYDNCNETIVLENYTSSAETLYAFEKNIDQEGEQFLGNGVRIVNT